MRLTKARITEFQSIRDSAEFDIGDVTCLVGKNEAGKTALLKALYRLNPIIEAEGSFDATDDYPRRSLNDYEDSLATERGEPATVVTAQYALDASDVSAIRELLGPSAMKNDSPTMTLRKGYSNHIECDTLEIDLDAALRHLVDAAGLTEFLLNEHRAEFTAEDIAEWLPHIEETETVKELSLWLWKISNWGISQFIFIEILQERIPKFLYFDEYYQMRGQDNVEALRQRQMDNALLEPDYPLLGLIKLSNLDLDDLVSLGRTERLVAKLNAAANRLTDRVLKYWSQNRHLRMEFEVHPGRAEDPEHMRSGSNIWVRVGDTRHSMTTSLGARSKGFVWFFSFLAWYSRLRREDHDIILLLDEPGLSLHAKAQGDLLRYFEEELKPHHQLIYTTHSPFMVDPSHFERVRIVQDPSIDSDSDDLPPEKQGTQVFADVLEATSDSLFPLQGALGYEIHQSLFIGPNCLVVEGVSDLLYIQAMSAHLQTIGRVGLSSHWTITPVGGADKVPTFVALIGAQSNLNVAVLIDFHKKHRQSIENLYKRKLLKDRKVLTYAEYVEGHEADIEDMFGPELYLQLVNGAFGSSIGLTDLTDEHPRIIARLERYLDGNPLPDNATFNHYRPARYLVKNIGSLEPSLDEAVLDRFQGAFDALNKLLR